MLYMREKSLVQKYTGLVRLMGNWDKKNALRIFERRTGYKNIEQNVKDSCFWASCMAGILKSAIPFGSICLHKLRGSQINPVLTQNLIPGHCFKVMKVHKRGSHD